MTERERLDDRMAANMERLTASFRELAQAIAAEFTPTLRRFGYTLHVAWFEGLPWWRRWWHTVTGHR
jgi:hypothetical protein